MTVLGAAQSGLAAAILLANNHSDVFVSDSGSVSSENTSRLHARGISFEENGHTARALEADFIVTSPGIPATAAPLQSASDLQIPVYSELELASWFCEAPILAVTGSNGKTTTTTLLGAILANSGRTTYLAGNIGIAFSDIVLDVKAEDVVVLEVSSFQLEHIHSFRPTVAVLLNISPDHLNRYDNSLGSYAECKYGITLNQTSSDKLVYNMDDHWISDRVDRDNGINRPEKLGFTLSDNPEAAGYVADGSLTLNTIATREVLMQQDELPIRGRHNIYNSLAASIAARMIEVGSDTVRNSLASFEGIEHRLEFVREVDGVRYVNDSKATNVNALWYALESFYSPVVLIAGGRDKGNDYSSVQSLVRDRVRMLISIGESADTVDAQLGPYADTRIVVESLEDAVQYASNLSKPGETVLLSPACASFDMFANFEARGDVFKRLVANL